MIGDFLLVLGLMRTTPAVSYTAFNMACIAYAAIMRKASMLPVIFINTLVLNTTFYCTCLTIEPAFFQKLATSYNKPIALMIAGDAMVHILPSVCMLASLFFANNVWEAIALTSPISLAFAPFYSIMLNIFWGLMSNPNFMLSNIYTEMSLYQWLASWYTSALCHFLYGSFLTYRYIFRNKVV